MKKCKGRNLLGFLMFLRIFKSLTLQGKIFFPWALKSFCCHTSSCITWDKLKENWWNGYPWVPNKSMTKREVRTCSKETILVKIKQNVNIALSIFTFITQLGFPGGSDGKESACSMGDQVGSLGWEDSLEKERATNSSIWSWRIPCTV